MIFTVELKSRDEPAKMAWIWVECILRCHPCNVGEATQISHWFGTKHGNHHFFCLIRVLYSNCPILWLLNITFKYLLEMIYPIYRSCIPLGHYWGESKESVKKILHPSTFSRHIEESCDLNKFCFHGLSDAWRRCSKNQLGVEISPCQHSTQNSSKISQHHETPMNSLSMSHGFIAISTKRSCDLQWIPWRHLRRHRHPPSQGAFGDDPSHGQCGRTRRMVRNSMMITG